MSLVGLLDHATLTYVEGAQVGVVGAAFSDRPNLEMLAPPLSLMIPTQEHTSLQHDSSAL